MKYVRMAFGVLALLTCVMAGAAFGQDVVSTQAIRAPRIDGQLDFREWFFYSGRVSFEHGFIAVANDGTRLYLLVDVLGDDHADRRSGRLEGDWIEVFVDMDGDGAITPDLDKVYTLLPGSYDLRVQEFASSEGERHDPDPEPTYSSVAAGFGCFEDDGTEVLYLPPLAPVCDEHRVWEMAIDLAEVGQNPASPIPPLHGLRIGFLVHSYLPGFTDEVPSGFPSDFSQMLEIDLASVPPVVVDPSAVIQFDREEGDENGDGIVNDPIEITQAIQTRGNTLRLVANKETAVRVYVEVQEEDRPQVVTVSLFGERDGHDLPGSPLSVRSTAYPDFEFPLRVIRDPDDDAEIHRHGIRKGRDNLKHTANFLLPESWTAPDDVTFRARARFLTQEIEWSSVRVDFEGRRIPSYAVIPINEGTRAHPVRPAEADLAAAESYLKTIYPVPDVEFQRREIEPFNIAPAIMDGEILRNTILEELLRLYDMMVATGEDPLPDQIYGYTATSEFAQAAGPSAFCTDPGCGHVAGGNTYLELDSGRYYHYVDMAHEFNHNIGDPDTWADHVPGGGADGIDPEWMRLWEETEGGVEGGYRDSDIREFGFDTRRPWGNGYDFLLAPYPEKRFTVVPPYFVELMSYAYSWVQDYGTFGDNVPHRVHPRKWTSPYRWERMFDFFEPEPVEPGTPPFRSRRPSAYVSGRIYQDRRVELHPVFLLPGLPRVVPDPFGELALVIEYAGKKQLRIPFTPSFVDNDGNQLSESVFHFNVPVLPNTRRIAVLRGEKVLDEIRVSKHGPKVKIREPFGKKEWNGRQVLRWEAYDKDGNSLHYTIFYSPDGGRRWTPVKWGVTGNECAVDMDQLPGGERGSFKVVATDGYNTAEATSKSRLSVNDKPPVLAILQPEQCSELQSPSDTQIEPIPSNALEPGRITFEAHGSDLEDGVLRDESFLWFHGIERTSLGRGKRINAYLSDGVHVITLVAFDSAGNTAEKAIILRVGQEQIN
jgi:hypothetical protein